MTSDLAASLRAHDHAVATAGLTIPVGLQGPAGTALIAPVDGVEALWRAAAALYEAGPPAGPVALLLGGPTAEESPFRDAPRLLPGLVRYINRHPALSFWLAGEALGGAAPARRFEEARAELFDELAVALDRLSARGEAVGFADVAAGLSPLLLPDPERAELMAGRVFSDGLLAVNALVPPASAAQLAAAAALWRGVAGRLAVSPFAEPLVEWGSSLHERFALPLFLEEDLRAVIEELAEHGLAMPPPLVDLLLEVAKPIAHVELGEAVLTVSAARELHPRLPSGEIEASNARVQVLVRAPDEQACGTLWACGHEVALCAVGRDNAVVFHIAGIRYRATASHALHPDLAPHDPLALVWQLGEEAVAIDVSGPPSNRSATVGLASAREGAGGPKVAPSMRELAARFGLLEQGVQPDAGVTIDLRRR